MPLVISSLLTVLCAVIFYVLEQKHLLKSFSDSSRQTIIGLAFGLCAIYSTLFGSIEFEGAALNCRDSAPIIAGLMFGPWAGVLSGLIGGVHRYFAGFLGIGQFTYVACSIACMLAGIISALVRHLIIKRTFPLVLHAFVVTLIIEFIHMIFVPISHPNEIVDAVEVVYHIFLDLVISNSVAVVIAFTVCSFINQIYKGYTVKEILFKRDLFFDQNLFFSFQIWILLIVLLSFITLMFFTSSFYNQVMVADLTSNKIKEFETLKLQAQNNSESKNTSLLESTITICKTWNQHAQTRQDANDVLLIVADSNNRLVSDGTYYDDQAIIDALDKVQERDLINIDIYNNEDNKTNEVFLIYEYISNHKVIMISPERYEMFVPHISMCISTAIQIIVFGILLVAVYFLLKKIVGENLDNINSSLRIITAGNLDERVNVYSHTEFADLSNSINEMVSKLSSYIEQEANRYKKDLELANQIQLSVLPSDFPAFPERKEINIYATYVPARQVGGDFYDFYFLDQEHIAFVIADVSGKGIPAAMFMMRAKTALKACCVQNRETGKILSLVNDFLCDNNEAEMFVTAWLGILNVDTGEIKFSCAGHNPPIVIDKSGRVNYLTSKVGLVLGAMKGLPYKTMTGKLDKGEKIFLYTDGVTEATNEKSQLYGEDRLLKVAEKNADKSLRNLLKNVSDDIDDFVLDCEQFDDITMLAIEYFGPWAINIDGTKEEFEITIKAKIKNQYMITDILEEFLNKAGAPDNIIPRVNVAIDEIYSNICNYGYDDTLGIVTIKGIVDISKQSERKDQKFVKLTFIDWGKRFNPIDVKPPDTSLSAEERDIGGLGIYMTNKIMDDVFYEYKNNSNRLTIVKYFTSKNNTKPKE